MLKGIGASDGIGIGRALKFVEVPLIYKETEQLDADSEKLRIKNAIDEFCKKTEKAAEKADATGADGAIFRGHIAMIEDPYMRSQIDEKIESGSSAEKALETVCDMFIEIFSSTEDELTKQRAADITDIKTSILKILLGVEGASLSCLPENTILVTDELTPSMTAEIDIKNIAGFITEKGGVTSHSAIIARSLRIPAVLSVENALNLIKDGAEIIIDGERGEAFTDFGPAFKEKYLSKKAACAEKKALLEKFKGQTTVTADGETRELYANIGSPKDIESVIQNDAEGIGLFRTEFLFMDRSTVPTEDEQFEAYRAVASAMNGKEVIIRTLDIGGDKDLPYLDIGKEENPFMGFRAVRYCLSHKALYKTQLRAIMRSSAFGNISILLPLITEVDEIIAVRRLIEDIKAELDENNIPYKKDIKLGVMIETPAACIISDFLAQYADFFSIGTNDLTGYIMAADRGNANVAYLYSTFDPAVLRAIRHIIKTAHKHGIKCGMCGEAAADRRLIPLLISMGLDEFSVNPSSILPVREKISVLAKSGCDEITNNVMAMDRAADIEKYLTEAVL